MANFNSGTTVSDIISYKEFIDPITDFKHVLKDTLYRYISHLYIELKAKDIAIKELTSVFKDTITELNESNINCVKIRLQK